MNIYIPPMLCISALYFLLFFFFCFFLAGAGMRHIYVLFFILFSYIFRSFTHTFLHFQRQKSMIGT